MLIAQAISERTMLTSARQPAPLSPARLISYSQPVDAITPLDFLRLMTANHPEARGQRLYWQHADADYSFAGFGLAAEVRAEGADRFAQVEQAMRHLLARAVIETVNDHIMPRLFGGFAFGAERAPSTPWDAFGHAYFALPRYVLTCYSGITWLTINAVADETAAPALRADLDRVARWIERDSDSGPAHPTFGDPPRPRDITYPLSQDDWRTQITTATQRMRAGDLDKVVLSRTCDLHFEAPIEPLDALARLETSYAHAYRFLIEAAPGHAFFGATPELLIDLNGTQFKTAALAGSIKRGATNDDDSALAAQLWSSAKERYEHGLVVDGLRDLLEPRSRELIVPEAPGLLKLSNIQHLYTPIYGELTAAERILSLLETLHPTPALGGYPRQVAVEAILQTERLDRGWYAAPVGWIDANGDGTFAVAIRSAISVGRAARLYAGAGIVADSDPDREWDETRLKFRPMLEALNAEMS